MTEKTKIVSGHVVLPVPLESIPTFVDQLPNKKDERLDHIRLPWNSDVLGTPGFALGYFVKLVALGRTMPVKGVMVSDHILTEKEIFERIRSDQSNMRKTILKVALERNLVEQIGTGNLKVLCLKNPKQFYPITTYSDEILAQVVETVKKELGADVSLKIALKVGESGTVKVRRTGEELRLELATSYAKFGDLRGLVIKYVQLFRTKQQVEFGGRLQSRTQLRILKGLLPIYETGRFTFNHMEYQTTKELIAEAMERMTHAVLHQLKNHNYLMTILADLSKSGGSKTSTRDGGALGDQADR